MSSKQSQIKKKAPQQTKGASLIKAPFELPILAVIGVFIITTLIYFWNNLFGDMYFWEDFLEYVYPTQSLAARAFANGILPFWNPFSFAGMPFIADIQVGFFYPFNRLLSLFVSGDGNLPVGALQFIVILHFFIAQINFFFLAKTWKVSSIGSVFAAISYSFSLLLALHVIHPMIVYHLAWFPLIVKLFWDGLETKNYSRSIFAGLIFGFSMLSGHPQFSLYEGLFLLFMFLWFFISKLIHKEINGSGLVHYLVQAAVPVIIAAGIFTIQYLPSSKLADLSQRSEITYEKFSEGSLQFKHLFTSVTPKVFGYVNGNPQQKPTYYLSINNDFKTYYYWETAYYFGIAALIFGIFGIFTGYRTRRGGFLLFAILFGFLFAIGSNGFIYPIFYKLPFFSSFRNPGRMMFFAILGMSIFAGYGFDKLWSAPKDKGLLIKFLIAAAVPFILAFLVATGSVFNAFETPVNIREEISSFGVTALVLIVIAILIGYFLNRKVLSATIGGIAIIILAFVDIKITSGDFNQSPLNPKDQYKLPDEYVSMFKPDLPKENFRVNMRIYNPSYMAMKRNQGMIDEIQLTEGYNPLVLEKVLPPLPTADDVYDMYNVKYGLAIDSLAGQVRFVQRPNYYPRAFMVYHAVVTAEPKVKSLMQSGKYKMIKTAVLEENLKITIPNDTAAQVKNTVKPLSYEYNEFSYEVTTEQNGVLVFSEIYYPDWKAYVDGKEVKIYRADFCFRAIELPKGKHKVEMKYDSEEYASGFTIFIITILSSVAALIALPFLRKRNKLSAE